MPVATERVDELRSSFTLPEGIDPNVVRASLAKRVLLITMPKRAETQPKKISVTSGEERQRQPMERHGVAER